MGFFQSMILLMACAATLFSQDGQTKKGGGKPGPVFDPSEIDSATDPCVDFYQYACGAWLAKNPIPADHVYWARWDQLVERNLTTVRDILENAAVNDAKRSTVDQKIGDYYTACMDEAGIEKNGIKSIQGELDRIAALPDKDALAGEVARLHRVYADVLFAFYSAPDFIDANAVIAVARQGGLGLPEREYYLKTDEKSVKTRQRYLEHVTKMFVLLGESPERAEARGRAVMSIETALARGALDIVSNSDPAKTYHIMRRAELASLAPSFAWPKYFADVNAPAFETLNVATPDYLKDMDSVIRITSLDDWKAYLAWQLVHAQAPLLSRAFDSENFDFYERFLRGAKERLPRWRRCASLVDDDLGEALGQKYTERTFDAAGKERTLQMVHTIEGALGKDIMSLDWMSPTTKQKAVEKLQAIGNKIGYPGKWRDYSAVKIVRDDAIGNSLRVNQVEFQRQLDKIGKPLDRTEWRSTPPTVNASYSASMNDITLPAGILRSPFFDKNVDDAENLGAIGVVIGHELTHGFDNRGRKFDPKGNLRDCWTAQDAGEFERRAACMVEEYSSFKPVDDVSVNGKLTLGENIADNGGLRVAYMALMEDLAAKTMPVIDGFSPEKRFFLAYAQVWCQNATTEALRMDAQTNPHSAHKVRVNGAVQNMPGFQSAFSCQPGQPMVRRPACRVW